MLIIGFEREKPVDYLDELTHLFSKHVNFYMYSALTCGDIGLTCASICAG